MFSFRQLSAFLLLSQAVPAGAVDPADLIFTDSFETCDPMNSVVWDGGGDGTSWGDPLNWKGDTLPADGETVTIRDSRDITVVYDNSIDPTRITCLDSSEPLTISGGELHLDGNGWVSPALSITNGTFTVSGDLTVPGTLEMSRGTLNGVGTVTVEGLFTWTGGQMADSGETIANGGMTLSGTAGRSLNARTLTLNGPTNYSSGRTYLWNASTINNNGVFDIKTDEDLSYYVGSNSTFYNNDTVIKSAGGDVTLISANFYNSGTVTVSTGSLELGRSNATGTSSGDFQIASGSTLRILGGNNMTGSSSFTGAGGFTLVSGATPTVISGSYDATGPLNVNGGTLNFAIPVTLPSDVTVTAGTLEYTMAPTAINADVLISGSGTLTTSVALPISGTLDFEGGKLNGVGAVTVTGLFTWTGGQMADSGETIANGGMRLSGTAGRSLNARTLTLNGPTNYSSGRTYLWNASTINNNGVFDIKTDDDITYYVGSNSTFYNNDTVIKSAGGDVTLISANFYNSGTVTVSSGGLELGRTNGTGTSSGDFQMASGSTLRILGGNNMTGSSSFTGAGGFTLVSGATPTVISGSYDATGPLNVNGGALTFEIPVTFPSDVSVTGGALEYTMAPTAINADVLISGSGTLTTSVALPISGTLDFEGGTFDGVGTVTVTGLFTWSGGQLADSGETIANGGMRLSGTAGRSLNARTLTLNGPTNYSSGRTYLWNASTINNNGVFDIKTDDDITYYVGSNSTFYNNDTVIKSAGGDVTLISANFYNSGTVTVSTGSLELGRNNGTGTSSGDFQIASGSTLRILGGNNMTGSSSFTGAGGYTQVSGSTPTVISGSYNATGPLSVNGGALTFEIPVTFPSDVSVTGGALEYTMAPTAINADVLISGSGTLTTSVALPISGTLDFEGGTFDGVGTVTVTGLFTWSGGQLADSGETIANGGMTLSGTAGRSLNARTLTLNGPTSFSSGRTYLWNASTINNNDVFDIKTDEYFSHYVGDYSTFNNNHTLVKSAGGATTTIGANMNNLGLIAVTSGSLSFVRAYDQGASGSLDVTISSIGVYDSYAVSQIATLDGTLNISLQNSYEPNLGDSFDIMTFASGSGAFNPVNGLIIGNGKKFSVSYEASKVVLTVVTDP